MPIRVLLADDSEVMRKAVVDLLQTDPEIEVVAECASFAQTIQLAASLHPQVIVLDLHMGDEGIVSRAQLKAGLAGSRLLAICVWVDNETRHLAEAMGAVTLLDKKNLATELTPAIKSIARVQNVQGSSNAQP